MGTVSEYFGSLVFDDRVMKATLSKEVYDSLKTTIDEGHRAGDRALPMRWRCEKDWAVARGAEHISHIGFSLLPELRRKSTTALFHRLRTAE